MFFWIEWPRFLLLPIAPECVQGPIDRIRIRLANDQEEGGLMGRWTFGDGGFQTDRFRRFSSRR